MTARQNFPSDFIDLSDESGSLKNLQSHPMDYGTKYLNEREILILVKGESKFCNYVFFTLQPRLFFPLSL